MDLTNLEWKMNLQYFKTKIPTPHYTLLFSFTLQYTAIQIETKMSFSESTKGN